MSSFERRRLAKKIAMWFDACRRSCLDCATLHAGRFCRSALLAIVAIHVCCAQAATPPSWKETGFSINANGMSLARVLTQFGATYGVRIAMTIPGHATVQGRLQAPSGTEFLERLASTYKFQWFVYSNTLHIVPISDSITVRLEVGEDTAPDAKPALIGLGLFEPRFGWGELLDEGIVFVSGPREYVNLVKEALLPDGKKSAQERQLMVFRLKFASATDRTVTTRGQEEVIPGVKTILSNILNAGPARKTGNDDGFQVSSRKRSREGKLGPGEARQMTFGARAGDSRTNESSAKGRESRQQNNQDDSDDADDTERGRKGASPGVRIDADPSLNAILIYDRGSKRAMYQALITELDVEPQQVEIEALIVDIDRSKLSQLGAEWGFTLGNITARINGNAGESQGTTLPLPGSTILIQNPSSFYARLNILEGEGDAQVLAKPTVLTLENVAAVLDLSQTRYVPLVGERVADVANITAGTMLKVVPRIIREGDRTRIRLNIDIEDGAVDAQSQNANTQVTRSTITTQAIIEPQHTLLIGGYHSESRVLSNQKIPVLGDIPLFGALFQNKSKNVSNRERLFLITPRLVWDGGVLASTRSQVDVDRRKILPPVSPQPESSQPEPKPTPSNSGVTPALSTAPDISVAKPDLSNPGVTSELPSIDEIPRLRPVTSHAAPPSNTLPDSNNLQAVGVPKMSIIPEFSCRRGYCSFPLPAPIPSKTERARTK